MRDGESGRGQIREEGGGWLEFQRPRNPSQGSKQGSPGIRLRLESYPWAPAGRGDRGSAGWRRREKSESSCSGPRERWP